MKSSIFQISNSKIWRISALKVYSKLNQKVIRIILSTYDKPSLNMQKKIGSNCPISRDIQLQNFQGRNPSNFWVANLENRWLHKFILTLSSLTPWQNKKGQTFVGMHRFWILFLQQAADKNLKKEFLKMVHPNKRLALLILTDLYLWNGRSLKLLLKIGVLISSQLGMPRGTPRTPFPEVPAIFSLPDSPRNRI